MATVRYIVRDVGAATAASASEKLGFELVQAYEPAMAIVRRGDLSLWLAGPSRPTALRPRGRCPTIWPPARAEAAGTGIVVETHALQALVASLKAAGVPFRNEVVSGPGGRQILCEDPSGNVVELFQPG